MRQNVIHLERFYASRLGRTAKAMVLRRLTALWEQDGSSLEGKDVLGYGYCAPYLMPSSEDMRKLILAMPQAQGAMVSRSRRGNISCLTHDDALPFPPASFDFVFVAHALEDTDVLPQLLAEFWRVLKPEGQIVIIAPNRAGLWARSDASPFGAGRPFSRGQLSSVLTAANLVPTAWSGALYGPPSARLNAVSGGFERFGETVWPRFSGVILVQAIKRLYANTLGGTTQSAKLPKFVGASPVGVGAQAHLPPLKVKGQD